MRKKLTNTVIAKLFDTDVGGLGVRKMASGVATFIFEMRPKGAAAPRMRRAWLSWRDLTLLRLSTRSSS